MSGERQAATVERALAVLAQLGAGPAGFATLAEAARCGDAALARLLKGLHAAELITGGGGAAYALTSKARTLGAAIVGKDDPIARARHVMAQCSEVTGTGCAWFRIEEVGVRCVLRRLVPEGVGFISEGSVRSELCGHGGVVAACAVSDVVAGWHAETLRADLGLTAAAWRRRLASIRTNGYDLSHGNEAAPRQGQLETLARLSVPVVYEDGSVDVLSATGHGLSGERVFALGEDSDNGCQRDCCVIGVSQRLTGCVYGAACGLGKPPPLMVSSPT